MPLCFTLFIQQTAVMPSQAKSPRQWKVGDYCMAKYWEDKQVGVPGRENHKNSSGLSLNMV